MTDLKTNRRGVLIGAAAVLLSRRTAQAQTTQDFLRNDRMPYDAYDKLAKVDVAVPGGMIHAGFAPGTFALSQETILSWVQESAKAVSIYYGHFPVKSLKLLVVPVNGARVQGGTTWAYRGAAIRILIGRESTLGDLKRDWVMVHEMVHLALPDMQERFNWLSEGLAVYVEPIARAQAGDLTPGEIWFAMMRDMPKGLPGYGDEGLDNTSTWGRKYWGGAMFCLLADVEIRKQTDNRLGLQDAMRGVQAAGGSHEENWSIDRILATADKAVGLNVLTKMHDQMGPAPVSPDLTALWRDLGLQMRDGGEVGFNDSAPLAAIRAAITKPRPA